MLRTIKDEFSNLGEKIYKESELEQIMPLIDNGTLELKKVNFSGDFDFANYMLTEINEVLTESSFKYPVFDDLMSSVAHHYSIENNINYSKLNPKEIEFGKEVLFSVANIDNISLDNILNLKNELENELSRFKSAILDYSKDIESAPYSTESKIEIKKHYDYNIKPELHLLRNQIKSNRYIKIITNEAVSNAGKYMTIATVGIGISELFNFEKLISIGGLIAEANYKAYKLKKDNSKKIKQHPLFFINEIKNFK